MFRNQIDLVVFFLYLAFNLWLGLFVARRKTSSAKDYFLAKSRLPWYAIGGSIIASNISTEHFIGMVGAAYAVGFVLSQWSWGSWFTHTILIWVFLPYYLRGGIYTMPEFLERRFNPACRYLFAVSSLVLWIIAQMAVVMLAGAKALHVMFGFDQYATILVLAVLAGSYTIYGGLISVAWTDFLQFVVVMLGGFIVAFIGLERVGGIFQLMHSFPEKFKLIYPQDVGAWVASPIAVVFLAGVMWKRATSAAATFVLFFGFPYTWLVQYVLFKRVAWLMPFDNWLNRTFLVWITCLVLMIVLSLLTRAPAREQTEGIVWSWQYAQLPLEERRKHRGLRNLALWWGALVAVTLFLNGYVVWFQFWGPGSHLR